VRKALGIRTIFNILGPLTNPADAGMQLVGVYDAGLTETIAQVLLRLGRRRSLAVHGDDGLDELSISTTTQVYEVKNGAVAHWTLHPEDCGLRVHDIASVRGGSASDNAAIITAVLEGRPGPYRDCVLLNAGAAIMVAGAAATVRDGVQAASAAIDSGKAMQKLNALKDLSQRLSGNDTR